MRMTRTGVVMGTPYYMAPERARGAKEIDHRCDLYAAGAILYECITGRVPFEAESVNELLFKIVLEPLVRPREIVPDLDPAFEHVILTAMAREASNRFPTAQSFREALAPFLGGMRLSTGSGARVVVTSSPPPRSSDPASNKPISGIEATAPIDSDAMKAALGQTPSQGLSATGGHHVSEPPRPRRAGLFVAAGAACLALAGGVGYVASHRTEPTTGTTAAAQPTTAPIPIPQTPKIEKAEKPSETPAVIEPVKTAMLPPEPAPTAPPTKAPKTGKKDPIPAKTAAPVVSVSAAPPPPPPPVQTKGTSPRPIDTAL
jgi:serine/threonine-protein kinase